MSKKHLLIVARGGCGLWSMFFQVVGLIRYAEHHGLEPVVYFNSTVCWWSPEGYNGSRNGWEYFFEPVGQLTASEFLGKHSVDLERASIEQIQDAFPDAVVSSDYVLPHVGHFDLSDEQRQEYVALVDRRIRIKKEVITKLDFALVNALDAGATAVHYRGTDKYVEYPRQSRHEYYEAIRDRVDPAHKLFVATDDGPFLEWAAGVYGDRVLHSGVRRSFNEVALHVGSESGPEQAEECLIDVLCMSRCKHLVHGNSSVTNGVLVFNPTMTHDALHLPRLPPSPVVNHTRKIMSQSQLGQDKLVDDYLHGKRGGVFVDIGAYDGVTFSNTLMLERDRGWTGVCIEPLPDVFEALKQSRSCACVQACVGDREDPSVEFLALQSDYVPLRMLSGVLSEYDPRHLHRVDHELSCAGGSKSVIKVPMRHLYYLLTELGIRKVDYLSIDTEGSELLIIRSTDLVAIGSPCITIENNYDDPNIDAALREQGYRLHTTLSWDRFYVRD